MNWVPKGMLYSYYALAALGAIGCILAAIFAQGTTRIILCVVQGLLAIGFLAASILTTRWYRAFDYDGERKLSKQIIEGIADTISLEPGQDALDVGCGSGALAIAVAKRNPHAHVTGLDKWGAKYSQWNSDLCKQNAQAEGVAATCTWVQGDARELPFEDESFDAVCSNYCYHNITGADKQALLTETLRCLKRGGTFALHDLMSEARYGDMQAFVQQLKDEGYESVELIDTTSGQFMTPEEAKFLQLTGSTLLYGRK